MSPGDQIDHPGGLGVPIITVLFGVLLTALGLWGRFGTEKGAGHITPLIPAFVGIPLLLVGLVALKESLLKHAMHAAAMIGLLGLLGAIADVVRRLITGRHTDGAAMFSVVAMLVLCGVFVALCVNSFIQARRRRRAREPVGQP
jgi:hypothetical protein